MERGFWIYPPTLEVASVKLLRVELLPDEGLPTRPIRGSLPMVDRRRGGCEVCFGVVSSLSFFPARVLVGENPGRTRVRHATWWGSPPQSL